MIPVPNTSKPNLVPIIVGGGVYNTVNVGYYNQHRIEGNMSSRIPMKSGSNIPPENMRTPTVGGIIVNDILTDRLTYL